MENQELEKYIKRLEDCYKENHDYTIKELNYSLVKMENYIFNLNRKIISKDNLLKIYSVMFSIIVLLLGLINVFGFHNGAEIYYGGCLFFLSGLFVGLNVRGVGMVFLFSHGMTGLSFMLINIVSQIVKSPMLTEGISSSVNLLLYTALFTIIVAVIMTIIYNLSYKFKENSYALPSILILYIITIAIIQFIPIIFNIPIGEFF